MRTTPTRRSFLTAAGTAAAGLGLTGSVAAWSWSPSEIVFEESFVGPDHQWWLGTDLSEGMTAEDYSVGTDSSESTTDGRALEYRFDATAGHGMIWADTAIPIDFGREWEIEASFDVWCPGESDTSISTLHAYLGPELPTSREDFPSDLEIWPLESEVAGLERSLWEKEGWDTQQFHWHTPEPIHSDRLYLAIGISSQWETEIVHYVDDVRVELTPV